MKKLAWLLATPLLSSPLWAADLVQIYREAQTNDATFAAAKATLEAGRERLPQGRAGLLPTVSLTANSFYNRNEIAEHGGPTLYKPNFNSNGYTITLTQPLFRWQNWVTYDQSKYQVAQAEANFVQAGQDLILRTAQAYFDVLYATENLKAIRANKISIEQQLASAKKNFEVGTATIIDSQEAQSRFDLAIAQEIGAENDLVVKQRVLESIIGKEVDDLAPVRRDAQMFAAAASRHQDLGRCRRKGQHQRPAPAGSTGNSVQRSLKTACRPFPNGRSGRQQRRVDHVWLDRSWRARFQFRECRRPVEPADFPGRAGGFAPERSQRQSRRLRSEP